MKLINRTIKKEIKKLVRTSDSIEQ